MIFNLKDESLDVFREKCNSLIDFGYKPYDDIIIQGEIKKIFSFISKKVLFEGYCDKCRQKKENMPGQFKFNQVTFLNQNSINLGGYQ